MIFRVQPGTQIIPAAQYLSHISVKNTSSEDARQNQLCLLTTRAFARCMRGGYTRKTLREAEEKGRQKRHTGRSSTFFPTYTTPFCHTTPFLHVFYGHSGLSLLTHSKEASIDSFRSVVCGDEAMDPSMNMVPG